MGPGERTRNMSSTIFTVEGMFHSHGAIAVDDLLDVAVVSCDGHLLVPLVDLLALVRIDADAEVVLVNAHDGASWALRMPEIIDGDDLFLQLQVRAGDPTLRDWSAMLWSRSAGPSMSVATIRATSFASFVGQS